MPFKPLALALTLTLTPVAAVHAEPERLPAAAFHIDELQNGEWFEFGATFRTTPQGARITAVTPGTTAHIAGLKPGDTIVRIGTTRSGIGAHNADRLLKAQANNDTTWGYVYLEALRDGQRRRGIMPLTQTRRTATGLAHQLPQHGDMIHYMARMNAAQNAIGDPFANAPQAQTPRAAGRAYSAIMKEWAAVIRAVGTRNIPGDLARQHAAMVAAIETNAMLGLNVPDDPEMAQRMLTQGMQDVMAQATRYASVLKTYHELYLQNKAQGRG
ncbi:MAG: hypothetical protein AAF797_16690 [Planctomycetota bacterium]